MAKREVWGYADTRSPDDVWHSAASRDDAIRHARDLYGDDKTIWVVQGAWCIPSHFVPDAGDVADYLLEQMALDAYDECGEAAVEFPDVGKAAQSKLVSLLKEAMKQVDAWADENIKATFWSPIGEPEEIPAGE